MNFGGGGGGGGGQPQARAPSNPSVSSVIFWMESWSCLAFWTCTSFCDISLRQAAQLARAPWLPLSDRTVWDVELQNSARPGELLCPALSPLSALFEFEAPSRAFVRFCGTLAALFCKCLAVLHLFCPWPGRGGARIANATNVVDTFESKA